MKTVRRETLGLLHEQFRTNDPQFTVYSLQSTVYRGLRSAVYKLIPTLGRLNLKNGDTFESVEKTALRMFKERAIPFLSTTLSSDWEWLALAQHHGLPTRL